MRSPSTLLMMSTMLIFLPSSTYADTTLYACTKNGETTLTNIAEKNCDKLQTYKYPTYAKKEEKNNNATSGLRPEEIRQLESLEKSLFQLAHQRITIDQDRQDERQEKCAYYRQQLNSALAYFGVNNLPVSKDIELDPNILRYGTIVRSDRSAMAVGKPNTLNIKADRVEKGKKKGDLTGNYSVTPFTSSLDNLYALQTGDLKAIVQQAQTEIKYYCY